MNDTTSTTPAFEDRLWDALAHEARRPADELPGDVYRARPARRAVTTRRVGLGLAAAALAGTALTALPGGGATPAYAVEKHQDGSVTVTFRHSASGTSPGDSAELLRKLRAAGVAILEEPAGNYRCEGPDGRSSAQSSPSGPIARRPGRVLVLATRPTYGKLPELVRLPPGTTVLVSRAAAGKATRSFDFTTLRRCPPAGEPGASTPREHPRHGTTAPAAPTSTPRPTLTPRPTSTPTDSRP